MLVQSQQELEEPDAVGEALRADEVVIGPALRGLLGSRRSNVFQNFDGLVQEHYTHTTLWNAVGWTG